MKDRLDPSKTQCKICGKEMTLDSVFLPSKDGERLEMVHNDCVKHLPLPEINDRFGVKGILKAMQELDNASEKTIKWK